MNNKKDTSLINLAKAKITLLRKQAWDDFYIFAKYVCGRNLMEEQPHRELCDFLTYGINESPQLNIDFTPPNSVLHITNESTCSLNKLIMLPRGSFKSTVTTNAYPLWLLWHNQDLRIMIDSETLGNAKLYLAGIKDMIENNGMLKLICSDEEGNYLLEPNKSIAGGFTEEQVILKCRKKLGLKEASIFCAGVDNARTGMHPDVILMDDLVSERNVGTDAQIQKVKDHYRFSLSLLEPKGLHVIIGTRYHMADLYGELIEHKVFDTLIRPAVDSKGELYFPQRLAHERLNELKKAQGSYIFSCQYMLSPIDDSDATFKRDNIRYFHLANIEHNIVRKYILVDLAISERETADYTVVLCVGETADKKLYVLEYNRGHYLPNATINAIFNMYDKHKEKIKVVGIEAVAFQKAMLYLVKDEMRRRGVYMPLRELKADKDKVRRIRSLQPLFECGDIYLNQGMVDLERELLEFPFSKHDDIVDALAYVLQVMRPGVQNGNTLKYNYTPTNKYVFY